MDKSIDLFKTKIRIKDIAERANVSVGTVDRVLHNRGEVAQETRALIARIIEEMEYKPNVIASVLASKKLFKLAVLIPLPGEHSYWAQHLSGIERAINEISHFGVSLQKYFFEVSSEESLRLQYEQLIEAKPDAVLMVPVFGQKANYLSEGLNKEKIPFAYLDTNFEGGGEQCFIGQNSHQGGYLAARLMSYGVSKETTVLIVHIGSDDYISPHHQARENGFKAYLSDHNITETKIRTINIPIATEEEVKKELITAFLDYSFVRGLFVTSHDVYKVAQFVEEKKLGNVRLIGYDLLPSNVSFLQKGTIDFLISQKPHEQGYKGVMHLFNSLVLKQPMPTITPMPIDIVTKENVDFCLYL